MICLIYLRKVTVMKEKSQNEKNENAEKAVVIDDEMLNDVTGGVLVRSKKFDTDISKPKISVSLPPAYANTA